MIMTFPFGVTYKKYEHLPRNTIEHEMKNETHFAHLVNDALK